MSVSDITRTFGEDIRVLTLLPSISHGYLFHITGNLIYLGMAILALLPASFEFYLFVLHDVDDLSNYRGYMVERVSVYGLVLYVILAITHIIGVLALAWNIDNSDYIHVFLFLASLFVTFIAMWELRIGDFISKIKEIKEMNPGDKINKMANDQED